jgi:FAD/FMN-containing dehydrogenase
LDARAAVAGRLADIVGAAHVLTDPDMTAGYVTDWTGRWHGHAAAVVRPGCTEEVAAVLAACAAAGLPVVPQGGNTGLVGGSVPMAGEVLLSLRRLTEVIEVDPVARTLAAGAGVTVAQARRAAHAHGLDFGVDLASRETATLGGIVSTNAGGIRMIKYGDTRAQLLGVEAVLADGRVLRRWKQLTKDNVGYHLPSLLAGSEGTLAVLTTVLTKLVVPPVGTQVALVGMRRVDDALALLAIAQRAGLTLEAAELMTEAGIDLVARHTGVARPFPGRTPFYLLIEVSGAAGVESKLVDALAAAESTVADAAVLPGPADRLWHYRESHTEAVAASSATPAVKLDLSAPLPAVGPFLDALSAGLADRFPRVRPICFGHVADGNIHVNLLDVPAESQDLVTDFVFRLVAGYQGSISAEHGIGRAKAAWVGLGRSPVDIDVMRGVRTAFDPAGLLNPHILI